MKQSHVDRLKVHSKKFNKFNFNQLLINLMGQACPCQKVVMITANVQYMLQECQNLQKQLRKILHDQQSSQNRAEASFVDLNKEEFSQKFNIFSEKLFTIQKQVETLRLMQNTQKQDEISIRRIKFTFQQILKSRDKFQKKLEQRRQKQRFLEEYYGIPEVTCKTELMDHSNQWDSVSQFFSTRRAFVSPYQQQCVNPQRNDYSQRPINAVTQSSNQIQCEQYSERIFLKAKSKKQDQNQEKSKVRSKVQYTKISQDDRSYFVLQYGVHLSQKAMELKHNYFIPEFPILFRQHWRYLEILSLIDCDINDEDWTIIAKSATVFPNLIILWISKCLLISVDENSISKVKFSDFQHFSSMKYVDFSQNPLAFQSKKEIEKTKRIFKQFKKQIKIIY